MRLREPGESRPVPQAVRALLNTLHIFTKQETGPGHHGCSARDTRKSASPACVLRTWLHGTLGDPVPVQRQTVRWHSHCLATLFPSRPVGSKGHLALGLQRALNHTLAPACRSAVASICVPPSVVACDSPTGGTSPRTESSPWEGHLPGWRAHAGTHSYLCGEAGPQCSTATPALHGAPRSALKAAGPEAAREAERSGAGSSWFCCGRTRPPSVCQPSPRVLVRLPGGASGPRAPAASPGVACMSSRGSCLTLTFAHVHTGRYTTFCVHPSQLLCPHVRPRSAVSPAAWRTRVHCPCRAPGPPFVAGQRHALP